jgi:hypothetical protein
MDRYKDKKRGSGGEYIPCESGDEPMQKTKKQKYVPAI